jgi:DNA-binding response OmpR family regulator
MKDTLILIIDDDSGSLYLTGLLFTKEGTQVLTARDGQEGISKVFNHQPDLIILDVMLPGIDGFEVCRRIRHISDTTVIILTTLNDEQGILQGLEAGADDFLSKPFTPAILLARATAILRRSAGSRSSAETLNFHDEYLSIDKVRRSAGARALPGCLRRDCVSDRVDTEVNCLHQLIHSKTRWNEP